MNSVKQERDLLIAVFDGGTDDLLLFDFTFLNLKFYKVDSREFTQFVDSFNCYLPVATGSNVLTDFASTFYHHLLHDQPGGFNPNLYALAPIDFEEKADSETMSLIRTALLIMFPSELQLSRLVFYDKEDNGKYMESYMTSWPFVSHWFLRDGHNALDAGLLRIDKRRIRSINTFTRQVLSFLKSSKDFGIAVESYVEAFAQKSAKMAYINYCMALESLVKSNDGEITYRICRTVAVINSDSKDHGEILFFNMKQFYALRSRIVHGDRPRNLSEYFFKFQALVSRTLLEIVTLKFPDRETLSRLVDQHGYGDKRRLQFGYRKQTFNNKVNQLINERVNKLKR